MIECSDQVQCIDARYKSNETIYKSDRVHCVGSEIHDIIFIQCKWNRLSNMTYPSKVCAMLIAWIAT
jgi:hypothetical protein